MSDQAAAVRTTTIARVTALMRQVRACFQDMRAAGDRLHADIGITASTRAVLEHLAARGSQTVPQIASAKNVTRQHIQQLADSLVAAGLAEYADNPSHKRSSLLQLTPTGRAAFRDIEAREAGHIEAIGRSFSEAELDAAVAILKRFRARLEEEVG